MSKTGSKIETVGPFVTEDYRVSIDGYEVPNVRLIKKSCAQDGIITVILDNRFMIDVPDDQLDPWIWIVANAMAVAAGYSAFGENCQSMNKYAVRIACISQ